MDLEKVLEILFSNPDNFSLEYRNENGKESLKVNGKELTEEFDDSAIKEKVAKYKKTIEELDDCDFLQVVEKVSGVLDVKEFDSLASQESFTEEEAVTLQQMIDFINGVIREVASNKIAKLEYILENL